MPGPNFAISQLPVAGTLTGSELVPVVFGGVTSRATALAIAGAVTFGTRSLAVASIIPSSALFVQTVGYAAAGDGGSALYKKVGGATPGGFQSADGAFWQLVIPPEGLNLFQFGGFPSAGAAAIATAMQNAYSATPDGGTIIIPPGAYGNLSGPPTGSKFIRWIVDGATNTAPGSWPLPGISMGLGDGSNTKVFLAQQNTTTFPNDASTFKITRRATDVFAANGTQNYALLAITNVAEPGHAVSEFNAGFFCSGNSATAFNQSINAVTTCSVARTTGGIWGGTIVTIDSSGIANPTGGQTALELNVKANGTDSGGARQGILLNTGNGDGVSAVPTVTYGIKVITGGVGIWTTAYWADHFAATNLLSNGSTITITDVGDVKCKTLWPSAPRTITAANDTLSATDFSLIANFAGIVTLTLPTPSTNTGRILKVKTIQNQTVVSNSGNVVPLVGGGAGTAILAGTAGKWAELQSDGTNWVIMEGN